MSLRDGEHYRRKMKQMVGENEDIKPPNCFTIVLTNTMICHMTEGSSNTWSLDTWMTSLH